MIWRTRPRRSSLALHGETAEAGAGAEDLGVDHRVAQTLIHIDAGMDQGREAGTTQFQPDEVRDQYDHRPARGNAGIDALPVDHPHQALHAPPRGPPDQPLTEGCLTEVTEVTP